MRSEYSFFRRKETTENTPRIVSKSYRLEMGLCVSPASPSSSRASHYLSTLLRHLTQSWSTPSKSARKVSLPLSAYSIKLSWRTSSLNTSKFCYNIHLYVPGVKELNTLCELRKTTASRSAPGPTQPPNQFIPAALTLRVKRPRRRDDYDHDHDEWR
jgi:hypothetical protein